MIVGFEVTVWIRKSHTALKLDYSETNEKPGVRQEETCTLNAFQSSANMFGPNCLHASKTFRVQKSNEMGN